ncbi:MAG TPA: SDR family oxidoreductase [Burkholderiaceae bacterium]|jgi:3-oxoacyl-[acyl-carrier protein] reductase|nr:SDR family oxidoreductase [Burkholderiaceae bacterium]
MSALTSTVNEAGCVVISGGSKGLGERLARGFLAEGRRVATFSRNPSAFTREMAEADPMQKQFFWTAIDINELDQIHHFVNATVKHFGRIDTLVNNAASLSEGLLPLSRDSDIAKMIHTNMLAPMVLTKACSRAMLRTGNGVILHVSSINSVRGHRGVSIYSATKAAMDGFTRSLAREFGPSNIRVNSIAPGFFDSELVTGQSPERREQIARRTPLGRLSQIDEIADVALFLCSSKATFITGQTIIVDGGITC